MEREKEIDGNYADDDHDEVPAQEIVLELSLSQRIRLLARKIHRFAESIDASPNWASIRKRLEQQKK